MQLHELLLLRLPLVTTVVLAAGCSGPSLVSGLRPVYPELPSMFAWMTFPTVDTLQPTLRWKPFPGETSESLDGAQSKPFVAVDPESVQDIKYDLRIWTARGQQLGELVHEVDGLRDPVYRPEKPLKPGTSYYWTVRARFRLDGLPRASEWSMSLVPCKSRSGPSCVGTLCSPPPVACMQVDGARTIARHLGRVPPENFYRFKTQGN